jgi:DHA1 family tetracycline resistance protein-like MFS transporter
LSNLSEQRANRSALLFAILIVLIDTIGLGIIIPVIPQLVMTLTGEGASAAARYGGLLAFGYAATQLLFASLVGALSDRFGRRPVLLASLGAFAIDYLLMGLAPSIGWLFLGRILAGMTGASTTTAGALIADVSPPAQRAQNYGLIGAAFGMGFIIGPVLGGVLGTLGLRVPFFAAAAMAAGNMLFGFFAVEESLKPEQRRSFRWSRANPLGALQSIAKYPVIGALLVPTALFQLAQQANPSIWAFYTLQKFHWSQAEVGYSVGFVGLMIAVSQGFLSRKLLPRLGAMRTIYVASALGVAGYLGFAFADRGWLLYVSVVPFALGGLVGPALSGIMAGQVPRGAQGELQGVVAAIMSATAILGPPLMTQVFAAFSEPVTGAALYFPGAPFVLAAAIVAAGGAATVRGSRARARPTAVPDAVTLG